MMIQSKHAWACCVVGTLIFALHFNPVSAQTPSKQAGDPVSAASPAPQAASAQQSPATTERDGQHDFDFDVGTWKTHIKRLLHSTTGPDTWIEQNGTVVVRPIWDGRAELEEIEADGPTGHRGGLTLFLYNPQAHQWSESYANSNSGILNPPTIGEFKDRRGEFFGQEQSGGRTVLVPRRVVGHHCGFTSLRNFRIG